MGWRLCQTALAPGRRLLLVWRRGPPTPLSFNHQTYLPGHPLLGREDGQLLDLATSQRLHPDSHFWLRSHTLPDCSFYLFR